LDKAKALSNNPSSLEIGILRAWHWNSAATHSRLSPTTALENCWIFSNTILTRLLFLPLDLRDIRFSEQIRRFLDPKPTYRANSLCSKQTDIQFVPTLLKVNYVLFDPSRICHKDG
jgi:hypothetical protein